MLTRSQDLFRWARERRHQSGRFTEPSIFHSLAQRWEPVARPAFPAVPIGEQKTIPCYWQQVRRRWTDLTR